MNNNPVLTFNNVTRTNNLYSINCSLSPGVPSSTSKSVNIEQTSTNYGVQTKQPITINYYYDGLFSAPTSTGLVISANDTSSSTRFIYLCGLKVYQGSTISLIVTTQNVSNIGTFFYNPTLIVYTVNNVNGQVTTTTTETDLSNVTTIIPSNGMTLPLNFTNNNVLLYFLNTTNYLSTLSLSATIYNTTNSFSVPIASANIIYDPSSQLLVTPTPVLTLNTVVYGTRIWSGVPGAEMATASVNNLTNITTPTTPFYYQTQYDHTQSLAGNYNYELLYSNGIYQTKGVGGFMGYSNYSSYNNPDYSTISSSGYRYVTYMWTISPTTIANLSFRIIGCISSKYTSTFSADNGIINSYDSSNNKTPILCYCRLEDSTIPFSNYTISSTNTPWINGNSKSGIQYTTTNFNSPQLYGTTTNTYVITGTTNAVATFNVNLGTTVLTNNTYLYLRLGFPMGNPIAFTNIMATIS